jgi:hypothetical protein
MASFEEEATQLLKAGWQQCSTFYPNDKVGGDLGLPEGAILLVLTQACSVVSAPLKRDPVMELIVGTKLPKFNPRAPETRGGNARKFHVELGVEGDRAAYELDIYQRHFIPRDLFLDFVPNGPACSEDDATRVGNWVGRFYTRTAFPNALVEGLRTEDFQKRLEAVLSEKAENGETMHEQVRVIFGAWSPNDETGPYTLDLHIAMRSIDAVDELNEVLKRAFGIAYPEDKLTVGCVDVTIYVHEASTLTLESVESLRRITDWDLLSGLKEDS